MKHVLDINEEGSMSCMLCSGDDRGTLPTDCPGRPMTSGQQAAVFIGEGDFREGQWHYWPMMGIEPSSHEDDRPPHTGQSRMSSLIEQMFNVGSGFITAFLTWQFIVIPVWKIETTLADNFTITAVFTVISVCRGYIWRRYFNHRYCRQTRPNSARITPECRSGGFVDSQPKDYSE